MIRARTSETTTTNACSSTNCNESGSGTCENLLDALVARRLFCGDSCTTAHPQKIARAMHTSANHGTLAVGCRGGSLEWVITFRFLSTRAD